MSASLVLLHGWGLTPRVWGNLMERLPAGLDVATPPLPGHDGAPAARPTLAAWGDALLPAIPDGALLCGWSLGGLIALDLARRHPEKIARLVLIGTSACFVAREVDSGREAWPHGLPAETVRGFMTGFAEDPDAMLRRFVALQALGDAARRAVSGALTDALAPPGNGAVQALTDGLQLLAATDLRASLPEIRQSVLVLHGAADALMPLAGAGDLARSLPRAHLVTFEGCGHAPFLSRPAESADLIGAFAVE